MSARLTASGLARAKRCPAAYALPAIHTQASESAQRGTMVHAFLEHIANGATVDEAIQLAGAESIRALCEAIDLRQVPRNGETEVPMAFDVATGKARRLPKKGHREYDSTTTEIPGTPDVVIWEEERVVIIDFKSRWGDFDSEESRPQLEFCALMAARIAGVDEAECRIGVISEDGALGWHCWNVDWEDLARVASETKATWEDVLLARHLRAKHEESHAAPWVPDVTESAACRYCPAYLGCPAKRAAVGAVLGTVPRELTIEHLGKAWAAAKSAEKVIEALSPIVRAAAENGPLPTGDGRVVRLDSKRSLRLAKVD